MKLNELHVFKGNSGLVSNADSASVVDESVCGLEINPAVAARGEYDGSRSNGKDFSGRQVKNNDSQALAVAHVQLGNQPFVIKSYIFPDRLLI